MKALRLALVPFALLVVLAARLGVPLRFGRIWSDRLGHMAGNMECYLCEREAGLQRGWDFWYHGGVPANKQLAKMLARVVRVDPTPFTRICDLLNQLFGGKTIEPVQVDRDILNLFEKQGAHLSFTHEEEGKAILRLRELGIPWGAKWVYLIVRDHAKHPQLPYHSYRNTDIDTYEAAVWALIKRGYYVVRMGKKVAKKMHWHTDALWDSHVIDFAIREPHDDFMAMYLGAHCAFCLSSGTGPDAIPVIFRRPVCYVNYVPLEYLQTYHRGSLAIWKHHEKDGKRMTLAEIYASGAGHFMRADQFADAGITLVDNTPEEIKAVALEMATNITFTLNILEKQDEFWDAFPRGVSEFNKRPLHGEIRMRIGAEFLRGYQ